MHRKAFICRKLLSLGSVKLGRLVLDKNEPDQYFLDPAVNLEGNVNEQSYHRGADNEGENATNERLLGVLSKASSEALSSEQGKVVKVAANAAKIYQLENCYAWLKDACKDENTQTWLEDMAFEGESIYMILGYCTLFDVRVHKNVVEDSERYSLNQTSTGKDFIEADITSGSESAHTEEFPKDGSGVTTEQVCAIQYGKIELKWYSSSKLDGDSIAQEGFWKSHQGKRDSDKGENDLLDAVIRDDLELEDDLERFLRE